jgi:hypothetical protein
VRKLKEKKRGWLLLYVEYWMDAGGWYENGKYNFRGKVLYIEYIRGVTLVLAQTAWSGPEIRHTLDPSLLSLLVVPLVRELRSTRSCDFLNRGGGFIKGILRGVRCTKSLRVFFLTVLFRKQDYGTYIQKQLKEGLLLHFTGLCGWRHSRDSSVRWYFVLIPPR